MISSLFAVAFLGPTRQRHLNKLQASRSAFLDGRNHSIAVIADNRPNVRAEHHKRKTHQGQVLRVLYVLIGSDDHVESRGLGSFEQFSVFDLRWPIHLENREDFVLWKKVAHSD